MNRERFEERKKSFRSALKQLRKSLAMRRSDIVRDAAIQRFEFTYELAWKAMKLWLESKDIDVRNPKDTLRAALEQGLINDGNAWTRLHEQRNLTSHTYDEPTADEVYKAIRKYAIPLFEALAQRLEAFPE